MLKLFYFLFLELDELKLHFGSSMAERIKLPLHLRHLHLHFVSVKLIFLISFVSPHGSTSWSNEIYIQKHKRLQSFWGYQHIVSQDSLFGCGLPSPCVWHCHCQRQHGWKVHLSLPPWQWPLSTHQLWGTTFCKERKTRTISLHCVLISYRGSPLFCTETVKFIYLAAMIFYVCGQCNHHLLIWCAVSISLSFEKYSNDSSKLKILLTTV